MKRRKILSPIFWGFILMLEPLCGSVYAQAFFYKSDALLPFPADKDTFAVDINNDHLLDYFDRNGGLHINTGSGYRDSIGAQRYSRIYSMDFADVNGDGLIDICISRADWSSESHTIYAAELWINTKYGTFNKTTILSCFGSISFGIISEKHMILLSGRDVLEGTDGQIIHDNYVTKVYSIIPNSNELVENNYEIPIVTKSRFVDFNNDGYLDIQADSMIYIQKPDLQITTLINPGLHDCCSSSIGFGDVFGTGDFGYVYSGYNDTGKNSTLHHNLEAISFSKGIGKPILLDLNRDSKVDIVMNDSVYDYNAGSVTLLRTLNCKTPIFNDLNADGILDMVCDSILFRGTKVGRFDSVGVVNGIITNIVDIDGNHLPELIYTDRVLKSLRVSEVSPDFTLKEKTYPGLIRDGSWGDLDGNGKMDLVSQGFVYFQNSDGMFIERHLPVVTVESHLGDFDGDGDLDILYNWYEIGFELTHTMCFNILRNDGKGNFDFYPSLGANGIQSPPPQLKGGKIGWADFDGDGDLDIWTSYDVYYMGLANRFYLNQLNEPTKKNPRAITEIHSQVLKSGVNISWKFPITLINQTTFNLRVGSSPYSDDIVASNSDPFSGFRRIVETGNVSSKDFWVVRNLDPGKYYYSVQAISPAFIGGPWAPIDSFKIGCAAPTRLAGGVGNGTVSLTWDEVRDANFHSYGIYGGRDSTSLAILDSTLLTRDTVLTLHGLQNDVPWYFKVVATDIGANESAPTPTLSLRPDGTPPRPPVGLTVQAGSGQVKLSWNAVADLDFSKYVIYRDFGSGGSAPFYAIDSLTGRNDTTCTISGLTNQSTYHFRIKSVDTVGNSSDFSSVVAATLTGLASSPDSLHFDKVLRGQSLEIPVTLRNPTEAEITVSNLTFSNAQFGTRDPTHFTVGAKTETSVKIFFSPSGTGLFTGLLDIVSDAAVNPDFQLRLSGQGVSPLLALDRASLDFGEVRVGQAKSLNFTLTNRGDGSLRIDSLRSSDAGFQIESNALVVEPGAGISMRVQFTPSDTGIWKDHSLWVYGNQAEGKTLISLAGKGVNIHVYPEAYTVDLGTMGLAESRQVPIFWKNDGNGIVVIDSIHLQGAGFSLTGAPTSLPAKGEISSVLKFSTPTPRGGDFSGQVQLFYEGASVTTSVSAHATAPPTASITHMDGKTIVWDTSKAVSIVAKGEDGDDAGLGNPIAHYLWASSRDGRLRFDEPTLSMRASDFSIGAHLLNLRVVDNEGDTSVAVSETLVVMGQKPIVKLQDVNQKGIILKGGEGLHLKAVAYDLDEGATPTADSLHAFSIISNIQGILTHEKDAVIPSGDLRIGVHGIYAMAVDNENDTSYSDTLWVPVQPGIGRVLLVAGTAFQDYAYFWSNISPNCNWVYGRLIKRGFSNEQVDYLNPVGWQSLASPYINSHIVDTTDINLATFKQRLLATKNDVKNGVPLLVVLLGHGQASNQKGKFFLNDAEALQPDSLSAWLDLIDTDPQLNTPIIVLLDFCYSGSFFSRLLSGKQNRILIASSSPDRQAYFVEGRSFSQIFFNSVQQGKSVTDAFIAAKTWSDAVAPSRDTRAEPLLSGNPDVLYNQEEGDYRPLRDVFIGGTHNFQGVESAWDSLRIENIGNHQLRIIAKDSGRHPDSAWFALLTDATKSGNGNASPWKAGIMQIDSSGKYWADVDINAEAGNSVTITLFGQLGREPMMPLSRTIQLSSVNLAKSKTPNSIQLRSAGPNPFEDFTTFRFWVDYPRVLELHVYNVKGRLCKSWKGLMPRGEIGWTWDGTDDLGLNLKSGIYWAQWRSGSWNNWKVLVKKK